LSNIFKFAPVAYAQFPNALVDDRLAKLKFYSVKMYLLILRQAQRYSNPRVQISTLEAIQIGLKENSHRAARTELMQHKLAQSGRVNNNGLWWYHVLNPSTGEPLPRSDEKVDLNKLPADEIKKYFLHHLKDFDVVDDANGLKARCPFHDTVKLRTKPLSVMLSDGGVWHCFKCNKSGKLVDFEKAMGLREGRGVMTTKDAFARIRRLVDASTAAQFVLDRIAVEDETTPMI